jgi:hypothetical protein
LILTKIGWATFWAIYLVILFLVKLELFVPSDLCIN